MKHCNDISLRIYDWLTQNFPIVQQRELGADVSLLESGILDSLGTLEVVEFLEVEFGIQVTDEEMVADHFESIHAIAGFVESKIDDTTVT